jgi:hypothetical protein
MQTSMITQWRKMASFTTSVWLAKHDIINRLLAARSRANGL